MSNKGKFGHSCICCGEMASLMNQIYDLKWALHIEVAGDHGHECDCKDHMEEARRLLGDFKCPGSHCLGKKVNDDLPGMLSNQRSTWMNNTITSTKPLTANFIRRLSQRWVAMQKRKHFTGRMYPGLLVPLSEQDTWRESLAKNPHMMEMVQASMRPEECYCKDRRCQKEK